MMFDGRGQHRLCNQSKQRDQEHICARRRSRGGCSRHHRARRLEQHCTQPEQSQQPAQDNLSAGCCRQPVLVCRQKCGRCLCPCLYLWPCGCLSCPRPCTCIKHHIVHKLMQPIVWHNVCACRLARSKTALLILLLLSSKALPLVCALAHRV